MRLKRSAAAPPHSAPAWGFHLHEALAVQIIPDTAEDPGTFDEGVLHIRVHNQIHVSLTVTEIRVGQSVELLGKDLQTLGQQGYGSGMYGNLAGFRGEYFALDADDVADIILLEILVRIFADAVSGHIGLDASLQVLDIAERCFTHYTLLHDTAGHSHLFAFQRVILSLISAL